jgi:hypothetical protein
MSKTETEPTPTAEKGEITELIKDTEYGSHVVFLRRKEQHGHLPKEILADAKVKLSSVFHNRQPLRGFDVDSLEEKTYLKEILDEGPESPNWGKLVRQFWAEMRVQVEFRGLPLEIGFSAKHSPINASDYAIYAFAKRHPHVADSLEDMEKDVRKNFYIQDPSKEVAKKNTSVQLGKRADREYIKASEDEVRMRNLLRVLSPTNIDKIDAEGTENMLFDIKNAEPKKFLSAALDPNLDMRAEISFFIEKGVLQKIGNTILNMDETLAQDMDECIKVLKNPKNSGLLNTLRAKYKEATR